MLKGVVYPNFLIQQPDEFLTVVTHKSLTVWSRFMDHRKAERVAYKNSIQDIQGFGQSEAQKLGSVPLLFCQETEFGSDIDR
jgi:hypothetical protein